MNWYVKLGPVVGNHTLAVVSGREKTGVRIFKMQRSYSCGHRVNTLTCSEISENATPEGSYHRFGVVFGQECVVLVGGPQL